MKDIEELVKEGVLIQNLNQNGDAPLLSNAKPSPTQQVSKHELPHTRIILEKAARGFSQAEIAEQMGMHRATIANTIRNPVFQQTLVNEIRRLATEDEQVVEIIKASVVDAAKLLRQTMNDTSVKRETRIDAAEKVLCRRYGKPNQPINRDTGIDLDSMSIAEIAKELPQTTNTQ